MSTGLVVDYKDTAYPLNLLLTQSGVGGLPGYVPTVALRFGAQYLDWSDSTFKSVGWTLRDAPLTDRGRGRYERPVNLVAVGGEVGDVMVAEFMVDSGTVKGAADDILLLTDIISVDLTFLRKLAVNRLEEFAGNPGQLILWDDDDVTPLMRWNLRDGTGGPTQLAIGAPAKRSRGWHP